MTQRENKFILILLALLFASSGVLIVLRQVNIYYRSRLYTATENGVIKHNPSSKPATIILPDGRLLVEKPQPGEALGKTFTISGYAQNWFEGNISIRIKDAKNNILYQGTTIASDNYDHPAPFQTSITLTKTPTTNTGTIEFNDYSAKDGELVYQKKVDVTFTK
jgi:hypothetical protein